MTSRIARLLSSCSLMVLIGACGDPSEDTCPDDFPVERDGFCYRADASVDASGDVEAPDASRDARTEDGDPPVDGGTLDADGDGSPDGGGDGGTCESTHPIVEGDRRFCTAADCYCASTDACYSTSSAEACCPEAPVCASPDAGRTDAGCMGTHPLLEGTRRYCAPGDCYCATPDSCHSAATAAACCDVDVVCG